jgi:hypothetical protein
MNAGKCLSVYCHVGQDAVGQDVVGQDVVGQLQSVNYRPSTTVGELIRP